MTYIRRSIALTFTVFAFAIFCDAQVFPAPEGEFHSEYDRFTDETRVNLLLLSEFMQIVNAKTVEMRLGDVEFSLDEHAFKMLREFDTRIRP